MTPRLSFSGSLKAPITRRAHSTSASAGENTSLHGADLAGVDQRLAIHAKRLALFAFRCKTSLVTEIIVDAVDHIESVGARRQHDMAKPGKQHGTTVGCGSRAFP